jgi:hypothetical protein
MDNNNIKKQREFLVEYLSTHDPESYPSKSELQRFSLAELYRHFIQLRCKQAKLIKFNILS